MGSYRQAFWATEQGGIDLARRDRASGVYLAFIPDRIGKRSFAIAANAAADIDDATRALAKLEGHTGALTDTEALARLLLRAESVASSFIEGLEVSPGRLLQADFARAHGIANDDAVANAVLGNVDAMGYAIAHAHEPLSPALITSVHRRLLAGYRPRLRTWHPAAAPSRPASRRPSPRPARVCRSCRGPSSDNL
jgi:hypothetical protein